MNIASSAEENDNRWADTPLTEVATTWETIEGVWEITADDLIDQDSFDKQVREEMRRFLQVSQGLREEPQRRVITDSLEDSHTPVHPRPWMSGGVWTDGRAPVYGTPR